MANETPAADLIPYLTPEAVHVLEVLHGELDAAVMYHGTRDDNHADGMQDEAAHWLARIAAILQHAPQPTETTS